MTFDNEEKREERLNKYGIDIPLPPTYMLKDSQILSNWDTRHQIASALINNNSKSERAKAMTPAGQIDSMNTSNVDIAMIFPTFAGYIVNHKHITPEASLDYANAYNRWITDYCSYESTRLKPVSLISRHDPATLVSQVEQSVRRGWSAITLRPEPILGKTLGDPSYERFWQACAHHEIAVSFHGGTHLQGQTVGMDRFNNRFALHACSHPMEAQMAFVTLLESGVFERNSNLKVAFLEAGCSWVPHWLWRLDNICYNEFPSLTKDNIKVLPSEYFMTNCWVGVEIGEPLNDTLAMIGHSKLIFGSDYPHPDHLHFDLANISEEMPGLSNSQISDILDENPRKLFNL